MKNIISYAKSAFETFEEKPLSYVDSLILSWLSYVNIPKEISKAYTDEGIRLQELFCAEHFDEMFAHIWDEKSCRKLFFRLVSSRRFRDIVVCNYVKTKDVDVQKEFSAVTFRLTSDLSYISFRGTEPTLLGWKEDFNMAFQSPIPSQDEARKYVMNLQNLDGRKLILGGHSKGGNLAIYAAATVSEEIQSKIEQIYSHDGPGFTEEFLQSKGYTNVEERIVRMIPQTSIIGVLLENKEEFVVIKSNRTGILQHDVFSWIVKKDNFEILDEVTAGSKYAELTIKQWVSGMKPEEREMFVDEMYEILNVDEVIYFSDLKTNVFSNLYSILKASGKTSPETKEFLRQALKGLVDIGIKNVPKIFKSEK